MTHELEILFPDARDLGDQVFVLAHQPFLDDAFVAALRGERRSAASLG